MNGKFSGKFIMGEILVLQHVATCRFLDLVTMTISIKSEVTWR
jgi:hypothetical protein